MINSELRLFTTIICILLSKALIGQTDYVVRNGNDTLWGIVEFDKDTEQLFFTDLHSEGSKLYNKDVKAFKTENALYERFQISAVDFGEKRFQKRLMKLYSGVYGDNLYFKLLYKGSSFSFYMNDARIDYVDCCGSYMYSGLFLVKDSCGKIKILRYCSCNLENHFRHLDHYYWHNQLCKIAESAGLGRNVIKNIKHAAVYEINEVAKLMNGAPSKYFEEKNKPVTYTSFVGFAGLGLSSIKLRGEDNFKGTAGYAGAATDIKRRANDPISMRLEMSVQNAIYKEITMRLVSASGWFNYNWYFGNKYTVTAGLGVVTNWTPLSSGEKKSRINKLFNRSSSHFYSARVLRAAVAFKGYELGLISTFNIIKDPDSFNSCSLQFGYRIK